MALTRSLWISFAAFACAVVSLPASEHLRPRADDFVNQTTCNGAQYTYESLAGYGLIPSNARDKFGDTIGGIGSSIVLDRKSWKKSKSGSYTGILYAIPDRGWNTQGTVNYQNRVHKILIDFTPEPNATVDNPSPPNLQLEYLDTVLLTDPAGQPTTGLDADATGSIAYPGFPPLPAATYTGNGFGQPGPGGKRVAIDSEGLALSHDGSFWISDEYGPYIYHFSPAGRMLSAIQPPQAYLPRRNGSISFSSDTPPIYLSEADDVTPVDTETGRNNNQGLEGLTLSADGKTLYALMQSALDQEGGPDNPNRRQARLLEYDISHPSKPEYKAEYVVTLPLYTDPTAKKSKAVKVAAQSEIHALGNDQFLVLARDSNAGHGASSSLSVYRHADIFDISPSSGATDIKSPTNDAASGAIASITGVLNTNVRAAEYCPFLDFNVNSQLNRFGVHNGGPQDAGLLNEKWESLALAPVDGKKGKDGEWFLFSLSDNDFITQNGGFPSSASCLRAPPSTILFSSSRQAEGQKVLEADHQAMAGYLNGGKYTYKDSSGYNLDNQALVFQIKLPKGADPS